MQKWSITLHGPAGVIHSLDTVETQFFIGTETASDVFRVQAHGVIARHAWLWISEAGVQVEDLGGGTLVNDHQISERVQVDYPASVQIGELTLVIDVKAAKPVAVSSTSSSLDITIPQRAVNKSKASLAVTIPQRTPTRGNVRKTASTSNSYTQSSSPDEASTHCSYTLVREIARGGMGQIYFGEDPQLKRNVAVKVSSVSEGGEDPRFSKEAEVLAQLAHPNIVPIHNIGVDAQGRPFYSMKLVNGRTLQAVLNQIRDGDIAAVKDYPRATLLTIFRKVCDAMAFAHSKGILHRDLKPENIMVGEYGEVLVMDWGLAKVLGERDAEGGVRSQAHDTGDYGMTMEGEVMGTPQYMSPEQAEGMVAELDVRSDIYSLGGILYSILTLRPPLEGKTLNEVLTKVKKGEITSMVTKRGRKGDITVGTPTAMQTPSASGVEVPEALQAVTLKAMARERAKRYASVEAFAGDIEAYQNGFATQAEGAGAIRQLVLFIKRHKGVSGGVGLFVIAAVLFTLKLSASERTARAHERKALVQMEQARRAAADSQMALAESAEAASDSIALRKALDAVPEDLRTQSWNYFRDRIDTATFSLEAPEGMSWTSLVDCPSDPARMIALRNDGQLFSLNINTGTLQTLWKPEGGGLGIGVSADGQLVAVIQKPLKGSARIEVCELASGKQLGETPLPAVSIDLGVIISEELCVLWGRFGEERVLKLEAWDWKSGKRLWEMEGQLHAAFTADQKEVLVITAGGEVQRREALTGKVLSSGRRNVSLFYWYPWNGEGTPDWRFFLNPMASNKRIRSVGPWTDEVRFETAPRYGNYASTLIPPDGFFATVGRVSDESGVLEIRNDRTGELARSFPFLAEVLTMNKAPRICAKANALVVGFPAVLKLWRIENGTPSLKLKGGSSQYARLGGTQRVAEVFLAAGSTSLRLWDFAEKVPQKQRLGEASVSRVKVHLVEALADGHRLLVGQRGNCAAYRIGESGFEPVWPFQSFPYTVEDLWAVHPSDDRIWTGKVILDFASGRELVAVKDRHGLNRSNASIWVGSDRVAEIAAADMGNKEEVKSAGDRLRIALWDARSGELLKQVKAPNAVWLCPSPDGKQIAEAGADKRVRLRNGQTLEVEQEFRCHEDALSGVAWHPTLPLVVTEASDGMVRVWNSRDFRKVEEFQTPAHRASRREDASHYRLEMTAEGRELNVHRDGQILVFQPESFQEKNR